MKFLLPYLLEAGYGTGTFQRPDTSGIRGQGVGAKERDVSDDDFPYGGFSMGYGQTNTVTGRQGGRRSSSHTYDIDELMGIPFDIGKSDRGTGGIHTGGRVLPGTSGEWGGRPKGGHWDNHVTDVELSELVSRIVETLKNL
jgi:hypothetical protein